MTFADSPAWQELRLHRQAIDSTSLRQLFAADPARVDHLTFDAAGVHADLSKNLVTEDGLRSLIALAVERGVETARDAMFRGERVNTTEERAALHVALRLPRSRSLLVDGRDVVRDVHAVLDRMSSFVEAVADGSRTGVTGRRFRNVINVGIGGSDLGPVMAYEGLRHAANPTLTFRFVSNVDPSDVIEAVRGLDPAETLVIVCSKTFRTAETMENADALRSWLVESLGPEAIAEHVVAASTDEAEAARFGVASEAFFESWDWVGGRYSLAGATGLSTMLALGPHGFAALLAGMHRMDEHYREAPPERNLPLLMGLLAVWYRNFFDAETRAVLPYSRYLARFPAYLQQLAMESNGKAVTATGEPVGTHTGAVLWGEPGTNGQHSFHQLLHQGTALVPCDLIGFCRSVHAGEEERHELLLANLLAQSAALAFGRSVEELRARGVAERLVPHQFMPGDRPSTVLLLDRLDAASLGALVALYEHDVFTQAAVWGIDPFDQWGVEFGKDLADRVVHDLSSGGDVAPDGHDSSTASLIRHLRAARAAD